MSSVCLTYHALLSSLFAVSAFNVEHENVPVTIESHPYTFCGLRAAHVLIHDLKFRVKEKVQEGA